MVEELSDTSDTECGCNVNGYTACSRLQGLAKPQFFLIVLILLGITQEAAEKFFFETVQSPTFSVPYTTTRWLILGSEIVLLVLVIPIIYWGSTRRRPGWMAGCFLFLSVSCFLLSSELLTTKEDQQTPPYSFLSSQPSVDYNKPKISLLCEPWYHTVVMGKWNWYWVTIIIIPLFQLAAGICRIVYWAFGISYIEDNVQNNLSPLLIAVAVAIKQYGPYTGLVLSTISTSITITGICWLGIAVIILLTTIFTGIFPKTILMSNINKTGDPGFVSSFKRVLTNKVIISSGLAAIFLLTFIVNASSIEDKYIESVFYVPRSVTTYKIFSLQFLSNLLQPSVAAVSLLISGVLIYILKPRSTILCIWSIVSICITAGAIFALIFLKCSATPIHRENPSNNLMEYCNKNCRCSPYIPFSPACSPFYPFVYYSPCHAGCTAVFNNGDGKLYTNCTCIPTGSVEVGHCTGGTCRYYWWGFQALIIIATAALSSGFIGSLLICFRTILPGDKTVMAGVIFALSSFMARVPFKLLYDFIANWTCLYFVDGQCKIYNSDKLATYLNLFHICLLLAAVGMLSIACFTVQDLELYSTHSTAKRVPEPEAEMTDFRSQLNQALKARRESTPEEQKLLSESQVHLRGNENGNRTSLVEDERQASSFNNDKKKVTLQKPLVPVKPPILKERKPSTNDNTSNTNSVTSTPPASPTHSSGTTVRNQGYLTTLL